MISPRPITVSARIALGFAAVVGLTLVSALIGFLALSGMERDLRNLEGMADEALLASEINADMAKALLNVEVFMRVHSADAASSAKRFIAEARDGVAKAGAHARRPDTAEMIGRMGPELERFSNGFEQLVTLYRTRDALVGDQLDRIGPVIRKALTAIAEHSTRDTDFEAAALAGTAQEDFLLGRLLVAKYLLSNSNADLLQALEQIDLAAAETTILNGKLRKAEPKRLFAPLPALYDEYREAVVQIGGLIQSRNRVRDEDILRVGGAISAWAAEVKSSAVVAEAALVAQVNASAQRNKAMNLAANAVAILLGILLAWLIGRSIARPLRAMTGAMSRLAAGDLDVPVPARDRGDEIGAMASAVEVFKRNGIERSRLLSEGEREQLARAERQQRVDDLIARFRGSVQGQLDEVSTNLTQLQDTAHTLNEVASRSTDRAASASAASKEASTNVESVAAATDEMTMSIQEISRQVEQTSQTIARASLAAQASNRKVQGLTQSAERIEQVVAMITNIAGQTNLLALNATIEAARAGEAGRGFAVVASEVKQLASQTAKATEEIAHQVGAIQASSQEAVAAFDGMAHTMGEIDGYASSIAVAVRQQSAVMSEISRSVGQAAQGSRQVSQDIQVLNDTVTTTTRAARETDAVSSLVAGRSRDLQAVVDLFLREVVAA